MTFTRSTVVWMAASLVAGAAQAQTPGKGDLAAKQNSFVVRYGQAAKVDVGDFFGQLGYPITPETKEALKGFPAFRYVPAAPAK